MALNMKLVMKLLNEEIEGKIAVEEEDLRQKKEPVKAKEERPKRCQHTACKTKLMLTDFACKCKGFYCSQHRFSNSHDCTFDYMNSGKELLAKQLVEAKGVRLEQI